ncbi:hypothetical protein VaNZ11_016979, partial [Volvox africanus]
MQHNSNPTKVTRTQRFVPAAHVTCPQPAGPFWTPETTGDRAASRSWPQSTEVVPANLLANKMSFTNVKTWVIRAREDNCSRDKVTTNNHMSVSSGGGNFGLDLGATPLRDGFRQVVDDTKEKLMTVRKVTAQAFSKEGWFRSWNFLKLQAQDKEQVHLPASAQLLQP